MRAICKIAGCDRPVHGHKMCRTHYNASVRYGDPFEVRRDLSRTLEERFWAFVEKTDGCWIWTGSRKEHGYGQFEINQKPIKAHRVAYFLTHGEWPMPCCLHSCDNPPCVNPAHLRAGTHKENMDDMTRRGRNRGRRAASDAAASVIGSM